MPSTKRPREDGGDGGPPPAIKAQSGTRIEGAVLLCPLSNDVVLSKVLQFAASDLASASSLSRTCRRWNEAMTKNGATSRAVWKHLCQKLHPALVRLYDVCGDSATNDGDVVGWKALLRRRMTMDEPSGLNQTLQRELELVFRPEGIVAYSLCCTSCRGNYGDGKEYRLRDEGIWFFKLFLDGMNYHEGPATRAAICYDGYEYIMKNWEAECEIIRRWCFVLGLEEDEYDIEKPASEKQCIVVDFKRPVHLEEMSWSGFDEEEE